MERSKAPLLKAFNTPFFMSLPSILSKNSEAFKTAFFSLSSIYSPTGTSPHSLAASPNLIFPLLR
jgi:hypothetical protein